MQKTRTLIGRSSGNNSVGQDWDLNCKVEHEGHCLINARSMMILDFSAKRCHLMGTIWWECGERVSSVMWSSRGAGGSSRGCGLRDHRRRENAEPRKYLISKSREASGEWRIAQEPAKGSWRVGRQGKEHGAVSTPRSCPSWPWGMLQGTTGEDRFLSTYFSKQRAKGHWWECMHDLWAPGTVPGDFFKKLWPLVPRHWSLPSIRYLRNSLGHLLPYGWITNQEPCPDSCSLAWLSWSPSDRVSLLILVIYSKQSGILLNLPLLETKGKFKKKLGF